MRTEREIRHAVGLMLSGLEAANQIDDQEVADLCGRFVGCLAWVLNDGGPQESFTRLIARFSAVTDQHEARMESGEMQ